MLQARLPRILFHNGRSMSIQASKYRSLRRSLLYVPASSSKMLNKSLTLNPDTLIYDLEDSVAPLEKSKARLALEDFVRRNIQNLKPEVSVRVNTSHIQDQTEDLEAVLAIPNLNTIVLPKVHSVEDLETVGKTLQKADISRRFNVIASIESARALWNLGSIAQWKGKNVTVSALLFGAEDFCADTSIVRTSSRTELLYARSHVVTAAKAFGLQAIDMVCVNYSDPSVLLDESQEGRRLGFDGKQVIHPSQIEAVHAAFVPSQTEIERAKAIIAEMDVARAEKAGAFGLATPGSNQVEMIDEPMRKQAVKILDRARTAGLIS